VTLRDSQPERLLRIGARLGRGALHLQEDHRRVARRQASRGAAAGEESRLGPLAVWTFGHRMVLWTFVHKLYLWANVHMSAKWRYMQKDDP
jgi:hypothetical protein